MCYALECLWDGSCKRAKGEPRLHWIVCWGTLFFFFFWLLLFFFLCYKTYQDPSSIWHIYEIHAIMFILPRRRVERKFPFFFLVIPPWTEAWNDWHSGFWEEVWGREHCKIHRGLENLGMASDFLATEKERSGPTKSVGALVLRSGF